MSNVTSVPWAGADRLTVKVVVVVPLLPSVTATSLIEILGGAAPVQLLIAELELRAEGVKVKKSAVLSFVSVQPPAFRKSAEVLVAAGAGPEPSSQWPEVLALLP